MFLHFFYTFVISIVTLSCQSTISLCFLYIMNFGLDSPPINTSKEPKGRFGPFSHVRPLFQKRPRQQASNKFPPLASINLRCNTDAQASSSPCVFVCPCVVLSECVCLCVSKEEEDNEGEKKSVLVCRWRREREKGAKCEINKIIVYTAIVIVYICTVTVANV